MAEALGCGRTKAHAWMHDSDLFELRADGRRGTLMRLRIDVREAIPARLRIPQSRRRCEQNREQTQPAQAAENTCIFRHAQQVREQNREQTARSPLHPPYKETEEPIIELPSSTQAHERASVRASERASEGGGSRAPFEHEWSGYLRTAPQVSEHQCVLAFSRPPAAETLRWASEQGLRYDRRRSEWKGVVAAPDARHTLEAACRLDAKKEANAAAIVRVMFWPCDAEVWATHSKVEGDVRTFLLLHGAVELSEASKDAFGAHAGRWRVPASATHLLASPERSEARDRAPLVVEEPPVPVPMRPAEAVKPVRPVVEHAAEACSPRQARLRAVWSYWLARCVEQGLLGETPCSAPWMQSESDARIDLCRRIAEHRGERITFLTIDRIEREVGSVFRDYNGVSSD
jgi:hypothetical protein